MKKKITITQYKVLNVVYEYNERNCSPNNEAVSKILRGIEDASLGDHSSFKTWSTLISLSSKKITTIINSLLKESLLEKKMNIANGEYYLVVTKEGIEQLEGYLKKRKNDFHKTSKEEKIIVASMDDLL